MAERKQREAAELRSAGMIRKLLIMEKKAFRAADYGFVLTTAQIDTYLLRQDTLDRASKAEYVGFHLKSFRAAYGQDGSDDSPKQ